MSDARQESAVTRDDIMAGLRALGVGPGAGIMVHSSLRSFGHVEGGTRTVIDALMQALAPDGTLLLPSFNHGKAFGEGAPGYYDPRETPTTNGAIPDLFWRLPGVHRSLNPTHAFAAWGREAERYTRRHHRTLTTGPESPLGLLWRDGGSCLMLGIGMRANTFLHVVEMTTAAPCLGRRTQAHPVRLPDGRTVMGRTWGWRTSRCPHTTTRLYAERMAAAGLLRRTRVGDSEWTLFRLQDCFVEASRILREGTDDAPGCAGCPIRPRQVPCTVPSDWDDAGDCLKPDSEAWDY